MVSNYPYQVCLIHCKWRVSLWLPNNYQHVSYLLRAHTIQYLKICTSCSVNKAPGAQHHFNVHCTSFPGLFNWWRFLDCVWHGQGGLHCNGWLEERKTQEEFGTLLNILLTIFKITIFAYYISIVTLIVQCNFLFEDYWK